ncbi:MAG TPA: putative porin [Verrucomicrobiae bacterium]
MKKLTKQNTTKAALFAGATALMALTPNTRAQTSVDALLNKLEQKGILSVDEAKELKSENATNSVNDFDAAMNAKFPMPSWITSYKFSGDFRGRFDDQSGDEAGIVARERLRYRLRAGLTLDMKDNLEVGFRIGSGDNSQGSPSSPLSNNQTLNSDASKKPLYIDTAYGKWTPINDGTWMLAGTFGKMVNPFDESPMVFDPDYTPEGAALQATYKLNDTQSFRFNSAAFVLDEMPKSSYDPFLFGGQIFWDAKWTPAIGTSLGIAAYDISNKKSLSTAYDSNVGNTLAGGLFATDFNPIVASGSVTYTLDKFPLYAGAFPIKLAGEYMNNPAASGKNIGYWGGVTFGKSGKKGTWDISCRYQVLDANAWWDQIVDDDNIAVLPTSTTAAGIVAGTGIKGHLIKVNYSITDALTFTFTCYANTLISNPVAGTKSDALHMMADIMWKF